MAAPAGAAVRNGVLLEREARMSEDYRGWTRVSTALLALVRAQYALDWYGIHGIRHWERVRDNGARLAPLTGADPIVVEFFAALHDSRRLDDARDLQHGPRAATFIRTLDPALLPLAPGQLELLTDACRTHTLGVATDDPTLGTCWDADRLDLLRVGRRPDPSQLITDAARDPDLIEWAMERSVLGRRTGRGEAVKREKRESGKKR